MGYMARDIRVDRFGNVSGTADILAVPTSRGQVQVTGSVLPNGLVLNFSSTSVALTAGAPIVGGAMAAQAGFYEAGVAGQADRFYMLVAGGGQFFAMVAAPSLFENIAGSLDAIAAFNTVNARSVPAWRRTAYSSGESCSRHSASVFSTSYGMRPV